MSLVDEFVIAVEFVPPYSPDPSVILNLVKKYQEAGAKAVSICSNPMGRPKLPAFYAADVIGPLMRRIVHYPCAGRSSVIFQSDMMSAVNMGVDAVLVMHGDPHPECSMEVSVTSRIAMLKEHPISSSILIGAAANPYDNNVAKIAEKKSAGADYLQTQPVFDEETMVKFADSAHKLEIPVLIGIMCPHKKAQLEVMSKIPGVTIPECYLRKFADVDGAAFQANAVAEATKLIRLSKELFAGVYLMISSNQLVHFTEVLNEVKEVE